jgi:protein TonB
VRITQQPLESKRNEEEGESQIALLVDVNGAVLDSRVKKSSGFPQLDAAARDAIGLCRFSPAVRDGEPTRSWATVRYVWSRD